MAALQLWTPYCGPAPSPGDWLGRWNLDPVLIGVLLGCAAIGSWLLPARAAAVHRNCFGGSMILLAVLFVSPFCALASALFSVRVVHHVALTAWVAPLLAAALPLTPRIRGSLSLWTAAQGITFWAWHAPPLYAAALSHDGFYWLMQSSLLASALGFWIAVRRAGVLAAASALLATMVQMGLLGALLTFAGVPLYAPHLASTTAWGMTPLEDQQLAGLIMWAPSAAFYLAAALLLTGLWFRRQGQRAGA